MQRQATLLLVLVIVAGCGGAVQKRLPLSRWLSSTPAQKSVTLTPSPGGSISSGDNFNGYSRGQVLVQVPRNWRVLVRCLNTVSGGSHSCAIVKGTEPTGPAFPGAATPDPRAGLAPGQSASFSFLASQPGDYRIASLVDDDELYGMWNGFQVGGTRHPSVTLVRSLP